MATPTANGRPLLGAHIAEPERGAWWAEVQVTGPEPLSGPVTIDIDGVTWQGTARSSADDGGRQRALVFGGADQLGTIVADRQYQGGTTVGTVVGDLLRDAGETLATAAQGSDATALSTALPHWQRLRAPAIHAIDLLTSLMGLRWRMLRSGLVAVLGEPTYPETAATARVLADDSAAEVLTVAVDAPTIEPGQTIADKRVRRIEWTLTGDSLRGACYYGTAAPRTVPEQRSIWTAGLDAQNSDGTLDLIASARYGLRSVPYYSGLPGVRVEPKPGAALLGGFAQGDPRAPVAFAARGSGGLKIGSLVFTTAVVSGVPVIVGAAWFDADAAGDAAAALAGAPPNILLPVTFTTAVQQ